MISSFTAIPGTVFSTRRQAVATTMQDRTRIAPQNRGAATWRPPLIRPVIKLYSSTTDTTLQLKVHAALAALSSISSFDPGAGACRFPRFSLGWKHVVVHPDHHWDEDDGVIEEVKFYAREEELQNTEWHRLAHEVMVECRLADQEQMLDVVPELDHESYGPPFAAESGKPFAQHP
jgi:hypothetical protein